jgi:disulfide bond formation protein DsbB
MNSTQAEGPIKENRLRWHRDFALVSVLVIITGILIALRPVSPAFKIAGILLAVAAVVVGTLHALKARKFQATKSNSKIQD